MDRISDLPQEITEKILTLMPIRDALRTSILSKKWRSCWTTMPRLDFCVITSNFERKKFNKHKLVKDTLYVLLPHKGPISKFSMSIDDKEIANAVDPIILHLSRNNNINFEEYSYYELPSSFFSLQGVEHIDLVGCVIEPPLNFKGFSMLRSLGFHHCLVDSKVLQRLLTNCPLLEKLTLEACDGLYNLEENNCTFVELFKYLPSIQHLEIYKQGLGTPQKLPISLVHLRILGLDVHLQHNWLSFVLNVINNSPNLEKLILKMYSDRENCVQEEVNLLDFEDYSNLTLDKLEQVKMINSHNLAPEISFLKLIMDKSPMLKKAEMQLSTRFRTDEEHKMLLDLMLRGSPDEFAIQYPTLNAK